MKQTILHQKLKAFLDDRYGSWAWDEQYQCYYDESYRSYDDIIDDKTIGDILDSKYPMEEFESKCYDWWDDAAWQCEMELVKEFQKTLTRQSWDDDKIRDELESMWYFKYPIDEYLKQEVNVDICIDTGDATTTTPSMQYTHITMAARVMLSMTTPRWCGWQKLKAIQKNNFNTRSTHLRTALNVMVS